jgi:hypothetical protein
MDTPQVAALEWGIALLIVALIAYAFYLSVRIERDYEREAKEDQWAEYDVLADASRIAMRRYHRRDMEVS